MIYFDKKLQSKLKLKEKLRVMDDCSHFDNNYLLKKGVL